MTLPNNIPIPFPIEFITIPQTNFRKGRTMNPDLIVMHIADGSKQATIQQFSNPNTEVSSHFLVNKDGSITQFVGTADTAYANGVLNNQVSDLVLKRGKTNPNEYSISIEHEGVATSDITPAQYATSVTLVKYLCAKWSIPADSEHIIRHRAITGTKTCPGVMDVESIIRQVRYS